MIEFDDIEDKVVQKLARGIRVGLVDGEHQRPYSAWVWLSDHSTLTSPAPGHPVRLEAQATTPAMAIDQVLVMLTVWLHDPLDPALSFARGSFRREVLCTPARQSRTPGPTTDAASPRTRP